MPTLDFVRILETLMGLSLGGVSIALLVVAITETVKVFTGLQGNAVRAVALGTGFVLAAVSYGLEQNLLPAVIEPYVTWFFVAVIGGLAGMGFWHLGQRWLLGKDDDQANS